MRDLQDARRQMYREAHGPVVFIGEGGTDCYGALYADVVFAKDALPGYCGCAMRACDLAEHFDDVRAKLEGLETLPGPGRAGSVSGMDALLDLIALPGLTARPATMDDLDAVVELVRACEEHDYGRAELDEDLVVDWARPGMDLAVMSVALFDDDVMVAEAEAFQGRGEANIHPVHRGRGIGTADTPSTPRD